MTRKGKIILYSSLIAVIALSLTFITYGYISTVVIDNSTAKKFTAINQILKIDYYDSTDVLSLGTANNYFVPGSTFEKRFTIKNTGNVTLNFNIFLEDYINNFVRFGDIKFEVYQNDVLKSSVTSINGGGNLIYGDVNVDGVIDNDDITMIDYYNNGTISLNQTFLSYADLNGDTNLDDFEKNAINAYILDGSTSNTNIGKTVNLDSVNQMLATNLSINPNETQSFKIKIIYTKTEDNQIVDTGKIISGRISFEELNNN